MIRAENIHKNYVIARTELRILRGANIKIAGGESVAIVGRSGAGKTTLLNILAGLDKPDDGRVLIGGHDLYAIGEAQRSRIRALTVGFVFQSYNLLPEMDVLQNVALPAMACGPVFPRRARLHARAMTLLEAVGLADRADHLPMELSGGEQQRVALARALMNEPQIVLADEPTGNLDESTGGRVLDLLFSLTRKRGSTLVVVTHDERIARACNRALRLDNGLVQG